MPLHASRLPSLAEVLAENESLRQENAEQQEQISVLQDRITAMEESLEFYLSVFGKPAPVKRNDPCPTCGFWTLHADWCLEGRRT